MVQGTCQVATLAPTTAEPAELLAPLWHTRALIALMLAVAVTGTLLGTAAALQLPASSPIGGRYLPLVIVNLGLCWYVCRLGLERSLFARLWSQAGYDDERLSIDVLSAAVLTFALIGAENGLQSLFGLPGSAFAHALVPASAAEKGVWILVAAVVGFSEELVYRGYLQRQLTALSGRLPFGIAAQALLFGIAHGEQGSWAVARFAVYAVALGWLAAARKSLLPCVLCHVAVDCYAGLV